MYIQHLVAASGILFLANAGFSLARLDESRVPSECKNICKSVVQASQKCDSDVSDRKTRIDCRCTWIRLESSGTVAECRRCMHDDAHWDKRDDHDHDGDDWDDWDDYDHGDLYHSCRAGANNSPATITDNTGPVTTMSSQAPTPTMQPSTSTSGSRIRVTTTASSSSSTTSGSSGNSPSTKDNAAAPMSMSASLAAVAGLVTIAWL